MVDKYQAIWYSGKTKMAYYDDIKDKILCPYCKHPFYKDEFYPDQDEVTEIECEECGKVYTIATSFTRNFTVQCGNDKEVDCDWKIYKYDGDEHWNTDGKKVYAICTRCEETSFVEPNKVKNK